MDERIWTNASPEPGDVADFPGLSVTCSAHGGALMISGDLAASLAALAPEAAFVGCGGAAPDGPHAIRIARDRAVLITADPLDILPGWHDGYALSLADDLYATIKLTGARREEIAAACCATPLDGSSPSATTLVAGLAAHVTRERGALVIRVQRPDAAALWTSLSVLASA